MHITRLTILASLLLLGNLVLPSPLHAQSAPIGLSLSPAISVAAISETGATRMAYTFRNDSTIDLQVTPALHPFHIDPITHEVVVDTDQTVPFANTENTDLKLGVPFTLPAGESKQIVLLVSPPKNITRDVMLTLTGTTTPELSTTLSGSTNSTSMVIGAHLFLTTSHAPSLKHPLRLDAMKLPKIMDAFSPLGMSAVIVNEEQTLHQIKGTIRLQGPFTDELRSFSQDLIAANSTRPLLMQHPVTKEKQALSFKGPFFPGKYSVTTTLLEDTGTPKHDVFTLYVLPLRATIGMIIAAILFGLVYQMKRKKVVSTS